MNMFRYGDLWRVSDELILSSLLEKGDYFIDLGANVGHISIALAINTGAQGLAVEANPRTYNILVKNIMLNGIGSRVSAINSLVGERDSNSAQIEDSEFDDCNSVVLGRDGLASDGLSPLSTTTTATPVSVRMRTLDSLACETVFFERIKLLKLDIEGYELFALRGATSVLGRVDYIYIECCDSSFKKYNYTFNDLRSYLEEYDFTLFLPPLIVGNIVHWQGLVPYRDRECNKLLNLIAINAKTLTLKKDFFEDVKSKFRA